jgi:PAS domain S-box-containing protein
VIVVIVLVWMNGRTLHQLDLDRQAANNARRDSERHFRALIENSSDAITLVDAKGTTTSASPAVNRILGYTISEFVGWNSFEFVHPDDREMTERAFAEIVKQPGKMATRQFRLRHKDGSWRWMEGTSANLLDEPSVRAIVDNFRDITERKQVEEALHESELRLRLFVEYAPAAIAMLDRNMQYLAVSRRWLADYRLGEQQIVGRSHYEIFPEIPERWMEIHRRCLAGAVEKCEEDPFPRADGSMDWVKWEIHPWHEKTGGVGGIIMFTEVITERKQAEERLQAYAAKLEQSNRELQDFASVASHDLQEPLRKIQAFGERLKAKCGEALDDHQAREYLERMLNAAARMRTLINDLLAFSRVITKAQPFAPVDLAEVTREVLSDLEISIEQTGARVEVGELPVVEVDSRQIRQLLQNLIGNALKFHRPGEAPVVRISGAITEDGQQRENRNLSTTALCQLRVTDNGIGFDEKYLDRIFNIFEKLHGRNEFEGTGIGLAICRKIAERHGGSITATSKPGHGATFIVSLPVKQVKGEHAV